MKIAFLGLGVMGYPMAGHLLLAGFDVTVFNRSSHKALRWLQDYPNGQHSETIAQAVQTADIIITCIREDADLREVAYGDAGILHNSKQGACWIDHSTASASVARELFLACKDHGLKFIDAPISGGQVGAETGTLTIMAGGEIDAFEKINPIIETYAKQVTYIGGSGSGQLTKMVNQICLAGLIQGLSEAINFASRAGLDNDTVIQAISQGAAQSWQMDNRAHTMAKGEFDFGFAVDLMRKDLHICLHEASQTGASLPITALVDQFYAELQAQGDGHLDTSSLIKRLK